MAIVLLVDPSQTIRRVVEMVFKGSGHDVVAATSATEGQQALARYQPSVAIVNYVLPDGSGLELCRLIKANPPTARTPVVVLGGSYRAFEAEQARAAGAAAVVMKPFKTADLLDSVLELMEGEDETVDTSPDQAAQYAPAVAAPPPAPSQAPPAVHTAPTPAAGAASVPSRGPAPTAVPRPHAAAQPAVAERPRYAPPAQARHEAVPRPGQAAQPAPAQAAPAAGQTAAYRGQPAAAPARHPEVEDVTQRAVVPSPPVAGRPTPSPAAPSVDREQVRAIVEDLLPQIALDTLQKMLADWLEARLRNYIHELVRQELSRYKQ